MEYLGYHLMQRQEIGTIELTGHFTASRWTPITLKCCTEMHRMHTTQNQLRWSPTHPMRSHWLSHHFLKMYIHDVQIRGYSLLRSAPTSCIMLNILAWREMPLAHGWWLHSNLVLFQLRKPSPWLCMCSCCCLHTDRIPFHHKLRWALGFTCPMGWSGGRWVAGIDLFDMILGCDISQRGFKLPSLVKKELNQIKEGGLGRSQCSGLDRDPPRPPRLHEASLPP